MNKLATTSLLAATIVVAGIFAFMPVQKAATDDDDKQLIVESEMLAGFGPGVYPFIDSTPHKIKRAHITITDSTAACAPGAAPPANMVVLVGVAGVTLPPGASVITAAENTGIGTPAQCVFHVTVTPSSVGLPAITDIVVATGAAPLTGINTITVTAEVRT